MSKDFVTKRPHTKSRAGCLTCKRRKVKCDEKHPKCSFCDFRQIDCVYVSRSTKSHASSSSSSSPPPPLSSSNLSSPGDTHSLSLTRRSGSTSSSSDDGLYHIPLGLVPVVETSTGGLSAFDLRLMHQYSVSTWNSLSVKDVPETNSALQVRVPQLAFENDFLMNAILGMASLHLQTMSPHSDDLRRQTDIYRGRAFSGFRKALDNITSENFEAALIMSLLLVVLVSQDYVTEEDDLYVNHWLILYRGLSSVMMTNGEKGPSSIHKMGVGPIFRRNLTEVSAMPVVPKVLLDMLSSIQPHEPDHLVLEYYCTALDALGMLFASLQAVGVGPDLVIRTVSWPSWLKMEFVVAAKEKRPRALIILAYYLSFVKMVTGLWWVEGIPDRDLGVILRTIDPEWLPLLQLPLQVTQINDPQEIANLLLSC